MTSDWLAASCHPIRYHVRKSLLANMEFNMELSSFTVYSNACHNLIHIKCRNGNDDLSSCTYQISDIFLNTDSYKWYSIELSVLNILSLNIFDIIYLKLGLVCDAKIVQMVPKLTSFAEIFPACPACQLSWLKQIQISHGLKSKSRVMRISWP